MTDNWTIRPLVGLGELRFGMQPDETKQLADVYGAVEEQGFDPPPLNGSILQYGFDMKEEHDGLEGTQARRDRHGASAG